MAARFIDVSWLDRNAMVFFYIVEYSFPYDSRLEYIHCGSICRFLAIILQSIRLKVITRHGKDAH